MSPTLLAVDGNSVLHRCFHASARTGFRTPDGRAAWAVRGFLSMLGAAVDRSCADAVVVGFDDPDLSHRRDRWPIYKAQRDPKPATLDEQLESAVHVLREIGVVVARPEGLEADDVLASAAAWAPSVGARTVIATSDRDSFGLIDDNTRMLRILNGGVDASPMLDPHRLTLVAGVRPEQYLDFAALRGDSSDNLPGVRGFGPKTAAKLLAEFDSVEEALTDAAMSGDRCRAAVGKALAATLATSEARAAFQLNRAVMTMHRDVPLGLDIPRGVGRLPLDVDRVRTVFSRFDLHTPSLVRSLTGADVAVPRQVDADASWRPPRVRSAARFPPLPKEPEPDPTLF